METPSTRYAQSADGTEIAYAVLGSGPPPVVADPDRQQDQSGLGAGLARDLIAGKGCGFSDRGDVALRGIEEPVRLHELRWE